LRWTAGRATSPVRVEKIRITSKKVWIENGPD
jgi:hypothetical protein